MRRLDEGGTYSQWFWATEAIGSETLQRKEHKEAKQLLLCAACEQKLGRWESVTAEFLDRAPPPAFCSDPFRQHSDFDYSGFKLFLLSYLWRASVSSLPLFRDFDLGQHEEPIRQRLLASDAGEETDYGFILLNLRLNGQDFQEVVSSPMSGVKAWSFALHRYFVFVASEESERFDLVLMRKNGPHRSFDQELSRLPMFRAFV